MSIQKAVDACGSQRQLARRVGVTQQAINKWAKGRTPAERCHAVAAATEGAVTVHELRPDLFGPPPRPVSKSRKAA